MSDDVKTRTKDVLVSVAATILSAVIVNAVGLYVGYQLLQQRVGSLEASQIAIREMVEKNKSETDATRQRLTEQLYDIQRDVSYIRGTLEKR